MNARPALCLCGAEAAVVQKGASNPKVVFYYCLLCLARVGDGDNRPYGWDGICQRPLQWPHAETHTCEYLPGYGPNDDDPEIALVMWRARHIGD